jgi:MFS family permease
MTNAPALISDIWDNAQRGVAMGVFGAMPWLGPVIGPIVGGFLSEAAGWRWVAAVAALFAFVLAMAHLLFLPETFNALILRERAALLHKVTGKIYRCEADVAQPPDIAKLLKRQFKVPFILLFTEPIVAILSLYMAAVFGILYLQFTAFPLVFTKERHWGPGVSSLPFIGISVGCNLALLWLIFLGNPAYAKQLRAAKGYLDPESRLGFSSVVGAIMMPVGLAVFAWTAVPVSIPWIVCVLSTVPYGAGMVVVFIAVNNYLVDAYLPTAASVMAGATVVRSLVGAFLPLATVKMYAALGINWGAMVVAFIAMIFIPVPL